MTSSQNKAPNLERLFNYIKKNEWRNISPNFTGFVKKEFEAILDKLDRQESAYPNISMLLQEAVLGRFTSAKNYYQYADEEFKEMHKRLVEYEYLRMNKLSARDQSSNRETRGEYSKGRQDAYSPVKSHRDGPANDRREAYSPNKRDAGYTPQKRDTYSPDKRDTYSPDKRAMATYSPAKSHRDTMSPSKGLGNAEGSGYRYQRHGRHEVAERGPSSPLKEEQHYDPDKFTGIDAHKENFDSLRLNSPDKSYDTNRYNAPAQEANSRPIKQSLVNAKDHSSSASALWGRDHGDAMTEKVGDSTYRQSFPGHLVDNTEREDKNRYRENFSSLNERATWARMENDDSSHPGSRPGSERYRTPAQPDHRPPMELVMQFKDLHNREWKDAYDETCSFLGGPEKTVRHLLWIVTEAWLIAQDIANKQLKDLQNNSRRIMEIPGPLSSASREHTTAYRGRELGEALPKSKSLLIQYRKQTAPLSIPYVREECRDKITKTLLESSRMPKSYLNDASRLVAYIYRCAELTWMLCVQNPPVILEYINKDTEGARFNREHYVEYNRPGASYDYGVWPLLRHGRNGQVLWKGIAQAI